MDCSKKNVGSGDESKVPIKLQKTRNITKIKGWKNKKFDFEFNKVDSEVSILQNVSDVTVVNKNEASTSRVGPPFKVYRNPELLDSLVKKIGDSIDDVFGKNITKTGPMSYQFHQRDRTTDKPMLVHDDIKSFPVANFHVSEESRELLNLPKKIGDAPFHNPAFISESLDEFLSCEPAILKLNNKSSEILMDVVKTMEIEDEPTLPDKSNCDLPIWNSVSDTRKVLDEYGNKPRTLAEKRRILEGCGPPKKKLKKGVVNNLKRSDNSQRSSAGVKRLLRSSFVNEESEFFDKKRINYCDDVYDSLLDDEDLDASELNKSVDQKIVPKERLALKKFYKLRHPHLKTYVKRESQTGSKIRQSVKTNLREIKKKLQNERKLEAAIYIQSFRRRILFEFMPLMKKEEVVTANMRPPDVRKRVGMVLCAGIGRYFYQEQLENIGMVRGDNCVMDEDFVRFAMSTVVDKKKPKTITRVLVPVLTPELLTFMHKYQAVHKHYMNFLIGKYKINVPRVLLKPHLQVSSLNSINLPTTKHSSDLRVGTSQVDTPSSQTKNLIECEPKSKSPVDSKQINDKIVKKDNNKNDIVIDNERSFNADEPESKVSPTSDIKFKKQVLKNGRIFYEDKRLTKLNYELRRLNHAFLEIDGIKSTQNSKDMSDIIIPNNVKPNKLAKVESEFHQTIMKANEDLVFVSSLERSRRQKKLPKKLEDTVLSDELALINMRQSKTLEKIPNVPNPPNVVTPDLSGDVKMSICENKNLPPKCIQPEPRKLHSSTINCKPKCSKDSDKTNLKTGKEVVEKGTVLVQSSRSILKKRNNTVENDVTSKGSEIISIDLSELNRNITDDKKKCIEPAINDDDVLKRSESISKCIEPAINDDDVLKRSENFSKLIGFSELNGCITNDKKKCIKPPVVRLTRLNINSSKIWCVKHEMFRCVCLNNRSRNIEAIKTSFKDIGKGDFIKSLKNFMKLDDIDFYRSVQSECNVGKVTHTDDNCDTMVPRIENVMTIQDDDFFNSCTNNDDCVPTFVQHKLPSVPVITSESVQPLLVKQGPASAGKCIMKHKSGPVPLIYKNYRFFCVSFTHTFSYIKFLGSTDLKEITKILQSRKAVDPNAGVILAYTGILNMVRESQSKQECVFQQLKKVNFDHRRFNNLPFGVYAVCRDMVFFGPYSMHEPHQLQAYIVGQSTSKDTSQKEAVQIPFVNPEFINEYAGVDFVAGYWWRVFGGRSKDQTVLDIINSKRLEMSVRLNGPILVPLKIDHKGFAHQQLISSILSSEVENDKAGDSSTLMNIKDALGRNQANSAITSVKNVAQNEETSGNTKVEVPLLTTNRKYPVINVKNNKVLSFTYPNLSGMDHKSAVEDVHYEHIMETFLAQRGFFKNEPTMLSVQPDGQIIPLALTKLVQRGNVSYFCFKNNTDHVIKLQSFRGRDLKNGTGQHTVCEMITTASFLSDLGDDILKSIEDPGGNAVLRNWIRLNKIESFKPEKSKTSEMSVSMNCVMSINALNPVNVEGVNSYFVSTLHDLKGCEKTDKSSPKTGRSPTRRSRNTVKDVEGRNDNIEVSKSDLSVTKRECNTARIIAPKLTKNVFANQLCINIDYNVNKTSLPRKVYGNKMKLSNGYIPITAAILEKNSGNSNKNKSVKTPTKERSVFGVFKTLAAENSHGSNADKVVPLSSETSQGTIKDIEVVKEVRNCVENKVANPSVGVLLKLVRKDNTSINSNPADCENNVELVTSNEKISKKLDDVTSQDKCNLSDEVQKYSRVSSKPARKSDLQGLSASHLNSLVVWDSSKQCFILNKNMKASDPKSLLKLPSTLLPGVGNNCINVNTLEVSSGTVGKVVSDKLSSDKVHGSRSPIVDDKSDKPVSKAIGHRGVVDDPQCSGDANKKSLQCSNGEDYEVQDETIVISDEVVSDNSVVENLDVLHEPQCSSDANHGKRNVSSDNESDEVISNNASDVDILDECSYNVNNSPQSEIVDNVLYDTVPMDTDVSNELQCSEVGNDVSLSEISDNTMLGKGILDRSSVIGGTLSESIHPISESKHSLKLPLLQEAMIKLVNEAVSGSSTINSDQLLDESPINEELKLVSNIDSLPSFLESYGIHFTDDYT